MSIHLVLYDGATPVLDQIALVSRNAALECLNIAGSKLAKASRAEMKRMTTPWTRVYDEKGRMHLKFDTSNRRQLGLRESHEGGGTPRYGPASMANFITWYLNPNAMMVVVGGKHRQFQPMRYDGAKEPVPYGDKQPAVSKASHSILHMLNFGEALPDYMPGVLPPERRVGYHFMEKGYAAARGDIVDALTERYNRIIGRQAKRGDLKIRQRNIA
jgi:hypothetical protein